MRLPLPLPIPLVRLFGPGLTVVGVLAIGFLLVTGRLDLAKLAGWTSAVDPMADVVHQPPAANKPENRITIATFNVENFCRTKAGKADVMAELAKICKLFDVVAIQEVCSPDAEPVPKLVDLMNAGGSRYAGIVSPPIGREVSSMEQYAFVWDTTRVRLEPYRAYVMTDVNPDRMHREPFVASFKAIPSGDEERAPFSFTLINVHTDPDEVTPAAENENELDVLADVYEIVRQWESRHHGEDDIILLGDLNSPADRLYRLGTIPGIASLAAGRPTNTPGTKELDHILISTTATGEFTRQVAVLDYQSDLGLTAARASEISDHRPVCAQFSAFEMPPYDPSLATAPATPLR